MEQCGEPEIAYRLIFKSTGRRGVLRIDGIN